MTKNLTRYVFAPDQTPKTLQKPGQQYYGWVWDEISIIVGSLPAETAYKRIQETNGLKLRLTGRGLSSLPLLAIFADSDLQLGKTQLLVTYRTPNLRAHRFYTVQPLQLDLVPKSEKNLSSVSEQLEATVAANPTPLQTPGMETIPMDVILDHVNIAPVLAQLVEGSTNISPLLVSVSQDSIQPPSRASLTPQWASPPAFFKKLIIMPLILLDNLCSVSVPDFYSGPTLAKDISATLQQLDVRLEQVLNSKEQFETTKLENVQSITQSTARYINFFNCVWLIVNDVIIGIAVGGIIRGNKDILSQLCLWFMRHYSIESLLAGLHWLDNWPVGLKLNTELSSFLCNSFAETINHWSRLINFAAPHIPLVLHCVGYGGIFGMTMILSLISDLLSLLTLHTYLCYLLATTVFARLLKLLGSLFNLFRGKRRNILRNRTDNWNYDMDQLLLGTILFTLVTFLLPTVTVYYLLFTLTRLAIIGMQASIETVLAFLNHFPLFALMLRMKDPARLPGGIEFQIQVSKNFPTGIASTQLKLVNKPIPYSRIFFQHLTAWSKLSSHYSPLRLLRCLLTGTFITPIPRYSIRFGFPAPRPYREAEPI